MISPDSPLIYHGTPASEGIAIGSVRLISSESVSVPPAIESDEAEDVRLSRLKQVLTRVKQQLQGLQESQSSKEIIEILGAQREILQDPELWNRMEAMIVEETRTPEYAIYTAFNEYIQLFTQMGESWIKDRVVDLEALRDRLIRQLSNPEAKETIQPGSVIFTTDLSPSQMLDFSESNIGGVVMQHGGTTSHAVIIAQSLGIPCVVGVDWRPSQLDPFQVAAIDAGKGEVIINPDTRTRHDFLRRRAVAEADQRRAMTLGRRPNRTACGTPFHLRANIEFERELKRVRDFGAEGIGLLRTETLFLRQEYFDTARHLQLYRSILSETGTHMVTIRLLDVGGDKFPGKNLDEANPYLGWRGIRMLLDQKKLLDSQLEAILTAASDYPGRARILVPMVSDLSEFRQVRERMQQVIHRLKARGIHLTHPVPLGIMVEVPSIALQARAAAAEVDFFSIGSNDLTQYVMAADRGNEKVSKNFYSGHPSVMRLIQMTWQAASEADIPISVCGEMAADPLLAAALTGMGIRELSMSPSSIPAVKKLLCSFEIKTFRELLDSIIQAGDSEQARASIAAWQQQYLSVQSE